MEYKINKDQMTPKERMEAFSKGEPMDKILSSPFLGESVSSILGIQYMSIIIRYMYL